MTSGLAKNEMPLRSAIGSNNSILGYNSAHKDEYRVRTLSKGLRLIATTGAHPAVLGMPGLGHISISGSSIHYRAFLRAAMLARRHHRDATEPSNLVSRLDKSAPDARQFNSRVDWMFSPSVEMESTANEIRDFSEYSQGRFKLSGSFSPSKNLTAFWARGVESFRPNNISGAPSVKVAITSDIQSEFTRLLKAYIGSVGQQRRYSNERNEKLTYGGRLSPFVQTDLCDRFQIIPDEAQQFILLLIEELKTGISEGVQISGAWGVLTVDESGDIRFSLSEPRFVRTPGFFKATEVE